MSDKNLFVVDLKLDDVKVTSGMVLVRADGKKAAISHLATVRKATVKDVEKIGTENIIEAGE